MSRASSAGKSPGLVRRALRSSLSHPANSHILHPRLSPDLPVCVPTEDNSDGKGFLKRHLLELCALIGRREWKRPFSPLTVSARAQLSHLPISLSLRPSNRTLSHSPGATTHVNLSAHLKKRNLCLPLSSLPSPFSSKSVPAHPSLFLRPRHVFSSRLCRLLSSPDSPPPPPPPPPPSSPVRLLLPVHHPPPSTRTPTSSSDAATLPTGPNRPRTRPLSSSILWLPAAASTYATTAPQSTRQSLLSFLTWLRDRWHPAERHNLVFEWEWKAARFLRKYHSRRTQQEVAAGGRW